MEQVTDYDFGVSAIDSGYVRPRCDAIHLIEERGSAAFVDTGTTHSLPRVLRALGHKGIPPERVEWVFLTHVHMDHAGGASAMMRAFPNARLAVHPRGARHMANPAHLMQATVGVYGEETTRRLYGEVWPIDKSRIVETPHGTTLALAGREFHFLDTPGHARHCVSIVDAKSGHVFAGDTFGLSYRELDRDGRHSVFPSSSPVQFDPEPFHRSLELLAGYRPEAIYVTHFSQVRDIPRLMGDMHRLIDALAAIGLRHRDAGAARYGAIRSDLTALLLEEAARQEWTLGRESLLELFGPDLDLNATGLECWLDARAKPAASGR